MRKLTICGLIAVMTVGLLVGSVALVPSVHMAEANAGTQWNASYFNNTTLTGSPVLTRIDDKIDFNWASGSPDASVNADNFSARWTKTVNFPSSGTWTFRVGADDGVRMWIDITPIVDEWHGNAEGYRVYTVNLDQLTAGNHDLKVEYYESTGNAGIKVEWYTAGGTTTTGTASGVYGPASWTASYFNNIDLSGSPALTRTDGDISFNWATGSPGAGVNADNFSARWTTTFNFPASGHWVFEVGADDGVRMWIDVTEIVNEWHGNAEGYRVYTVDVNGLTAGNHDLKVEYYEASGNAGIQVRWYLFGSGGGGVGAEVAPVATAIPPATVYASPIDYGINVRFGPGLGNPVKGQITYPLNYLVLGAVPDLSWLLVDLKNGDSGWVSNDWVYLWAKEDFKNEDTTGGGQPDFVDDIPRIAAAIAPPAPAADGAVVTTLPGVTTDVVNLRDGASLYAAKVIGSLPQGARLTVEAHNGNGSWYLVNYQGLRGWVNASFVTLDGSPSDLVVSHEVVPAPPPGSIYVLETETGETVTVRGRANTDLKLRDAASLNGKQIGTVSAQAEFVIEGRNRNGSWYLLTYNGVQGWVNSPYVTLLEGTVSDLQIR